MIALQDQEYYVPGLPNYLCIISSKVICISEGYKGTLIAHCHDENDSYAENNLKGDKTGWKKTEPVEGVFIKYGPENRLLSPEYILPNQRYKGFKPLTSAVCFTNEDNYNLTTS